MKCNNMLRGETYSMFIEYDDIDTFINDISTLKTKKWYSIIKLREYDIIEAYAQTTKNTYYIKIETNNSEKITEILNKNNFSRVKTIKTWEG